MTTVRHAGRTWRSRHGGARAVPRASAVVTGILAVLLMVLGVLLPAPAQARAAGPGPRAPSEARPLAITGRHLALASVPANFLPTDPPGAEDCGVTLPGGWYACTVYGDFEIAVYASFPGPVFCGPSICSYLEMQTDGNLVLYHSCTGMYGPYHAVWASNTQYEGSYAMMQSDGNLVVYNAYRGAVWASGTYGNTDAWLAIQSDGNLVIYAPPDPPNVAYYLHPIWTTGTNYC
jgi:hypothetical protein